MRITLLGLWLLVACVPANDSRTPEADADTDADSDTDADADSDADSDADVDYYL